MSTIIDVAKLAGVSQGTASNVLNGKGNVSSEKIRAVEEAAKKLGYTINERAQFLRKGSSNTISIIMPNIEFEQYRVFYDSFKFYAEKKGYSADLLLTNDNPRTELEAIQKSKSMMAEGVVAITCLTQDTNPYKQAGFSKISFCERKPSFQAEYFGFNYKTAGSQMAEKLVNDEKKNIMLITDSEKFSSVREYLEGFNEVINHHEEVIATILSTDIRRISFSVMETLHSGNAIDAIVTTNLGFAKKIREILNGFFRNEDIKIYTLSQVVSLPNNDYDLYELNYQLLGREVAVHMLESSKEQSIPQQNIYENDGVRNWSKIDIKGVPAKELNILTLENPAAHIMKVMANIYSEKTGTKVNVTFKSYNEIYDLVTAPGSSEDFDIFRLDVTWLSWFSEHLLMSLEDIDPNINTVFSGYLPDLRDKYSYIRGKYVALPFTPSVQLLFYRKDLFENNAIKRLYNEKYKTELQIPQTFAEYNRITSFFTEGRGFDTGVKYGANLTLGNEGVITTEFLTRFFSLKNNLYNRNGKIVINDMIGQEALRTLIELREYAPLEPANWWTSLAKEFANGDVAMMINFTNYASEILGARSKIVDKVGFALVPGGNPIYGGGSLGISKDCKNPEDALAFIKWITGEPVASGMTTLGSVSPSDKTYKNYEIINTFPWLELSKDCFELSKTMRLPDYQKMPFNEKRFLNIMGTAIKDVLTGRDTIENTLDRAQVIIDQEFNNWIMSSQSNR